MKASKKNKKAPCLKWHLSSENATKVSEKRPSGGLSPQICSRVGSHGFRLSALLSPARIVTVLKLNISFQQNKEAKEMRGNWFHLYQLTLSGCQFLA